MEMSPDQHNQLVAKTQGVTHFLGQMLKEFGIRKTSIDTQGFRDLLDLVDQACNDTIKSIWQNFKGLHQAENFPMAPEKTIIYFEDENRPQSKLERDLEKGMAVTVGRLTKDKFFDARYVPLSHNTVRGATGDAILMAELLVQKGYIYAK